MKDIRSDIADEVEKEDVSNSFNNAEDKEALEEKVFSDSATIGMFGSNVTVVINTSISTAADKIIEDSININDQEVEDVEEEEVNEEIGSVCNKSKGETSHKSSRF